MAAGFCILEGGEKSIRKREGIAILSRRGIVPPMTNITQMERSGEITEKQLNKIPREILTFYI